MVITFHFKSVLLSMLLNRIRMIGMKFPAAEGATLIVARHHHYIPFFPLTVGCLVTSIVLLQQLCCLTTSLRGSFRLLLHHAWVTAF